MAKKFVRAEKDLKIPDIDIKMHDELDMFSDNDGHAYVLIDGKLKRINNLVESIDGISPTQNKNVTTKRIVTQEEYDSTPTHTKDVVYYIKDKGKIYLNEVLYVSETSEFSMSEIPIINNISVGDTTITGVGVAGANIIMIIPWFPMIIRLTVGENGNWSYQLPEEFPAPPYNYVIVMQTEKNKSINLNMYSILE